MLDSICGYLENIWINKCSRWQISKKIEFLKNFILVQRLSMNIGVNSIKIIT